MKTAICTIKGVHQIQFGREHDEPKIDKGNEGHDAYKKRTWLSKCHADKDGNVFIPAMAFKRCIAAAAKYLSITIPGEGSAKYTKHFLSGIQVFEDVPIGLKAKDAYCIRMTGDSKGQRGKAGARVPVYLPTFQPWGGVVKFRIMDEKIPDEVFEKTLIAAGKFIGLGTFRPENGGNNGIFDVEKTVWE